MYKVDGEYCFEGLRVGPKVKIPEKDELLALLGDQPVNAATIRNITYTLIRKELARLYGTSVQEAADIIGNQLDCAPHEDISGYIFTRVRDKKRLVKVGNLVKNSYLYR